jgi:hypothetical protein
MTQIPFGAPGVASFDNDAFTPVTQLLLSNTPPMATRIHTMSTGLDEAIYTVVGLTGGEIVPAESGVVQAIGFTAFAMDEAASAGKKGQIVVHAHVNINALVWPASYDTEAKKLAAFDGAPAPTNIIADVNPNDPA